MQEEVIRYENIGMTFDSKKIFSGFSIRILRGSKVLLRGKSGVGKSTLFKMLLGFKKPSEGLLYYRGKPISPKIIWEIRKEVSYVSQDTDLGEGPVTDLLDAVFSYHPNREKNNFEKLNLLMEKLELDKDILNKNFEALSGGEKQRIGILISLLLGREIFLLDEATSALDSGLKKKVADHFLTKEEWTVFIISHDKEWEREGVKLVEFGKEEQVSLI